MPRRRGRRREKAGPLHSAYSRCEAISRRNTAGFTHLRSAIARPKDTIRSVIAIPKKGIPPLNPPAAACCSHVSIVQLHGQVPDCQ